VPEPRFAGASDADAAAARALFDDASPWERDGGAKRVLWVIARQHPGETMASWWMEGFVNRLLDEEDPVSKKLLRRAVVHVVPNMNPDGSARGHLRTNALGANLNREWANPRVDYSPEVFHVRNAMDDTGVDLMLDVHGDEAEPYCFIVGGEGTPGWDEERASTQRRFKEAYARACPDFQTTFPARVRERACGERRDREDAGRRAVPARDRDDPRDAVQGQRAACAEGRLDGAALGDARRRRDRRDARRPAVNRRRGMRNARNGGETRRETGAALFFVGAVDYALRARNDDARARAVVL
jgi:hypothetical protein